VTMIALMEAAWRHTSTSSVRFPKAFATNTTS